MDLRSDCLDCRSAGSVERGACQVCFAEVDPAGIAAAPVTEPHRGEAAPVSLRFADVVAELDAVARLASLGANGNVAEACLRARAMLERLRGQFLAHVILAPPGVPPVPDPADAGELGAEPIPA
jgi:hypothetical protein